MKVNEVKLQDFRDELNDYDRGWYDAMRKIKREINEYIEAFEENKSDGKTVVK